MKTLKSFANYLRENRLRDYVVYYTSIIREMDIPLIKLVIERGLVKDLGEESAIIRTMDSQGKFLQNIEDGTAVEKAKESLKMWEEDKMPGIGKNDILPSDLVLLQAAQKKAIIHFLPDYIANSNESVTIIQGLEDYYTQVQDNAMKLLFKLHKTTQKQLAETEAIRQRLMTVVEASSDFVGYADATDLHIMYINKSGRKMIGFEQDDDVTKFKITDVHPDWVNELFKNEVIPAAIQRGIWKGECAFLTLSGQEIPVSTIFTSHKKADGEIEYFSFVSRDIREEFFLEEMEKLTLAATQSFNSVIITNEHGNIEWVNEGFKNLTGYTLDEVKGSHGESLRKGTETGISENADYYKSVMKNKAPISYECKNYSKQGRGYWTITTLTPVLDKKGEVKRIIAIDTDISFRKQMEEELLHANQIAEHSLIRSNNALNELMKTKTQLEKSMHIKEEFLANMSHEIRTPMNAIVGFTDLALKTPLSQEQKQYIDAIKTSGENLLVIINDILNFSKIQSGKVSFEQIEFSISQVVSTVVELILPASKEKNIKLFQSIDKKVPDRLIGDPTRLNQILLNLVSNGVKFTQRGEVKISIEPVAENNETVTLKFSISDTGIGIPQDKLSTIFDAFTQATYDTTRKYGGTGLGLAIVKQLTGLLGGDIKVTSEVNKGSVFTFSLVYKKAGVQYSTPQQKPVPQKLQDETGKIKDLHILLVEDNTLNQILAQKVLSDFGWKVEVADNGLIAVEKIKKQNFDMVLMDIQMPEMDGYETTHFIREKLALPKSAIPIIAMTAHAISGEEEKCLKIGMNEYISKPFNTQILYQKIISVLNNGTNQNNKEKQRMESNNPTKHTDLTYLQEVANGSNEFMISMLNIFMEQTPAAIDTMEKALKNKDWKSLRLIAHKIKPSIMFVGLSEIKDDIMLLENYAAEESHLDEIPAMVDKIKKACDISIVELKEELKKLQ